MYSLLYVDDDPFLCELGKKFLEHTGDFTVIPVRNALDALHRIEEYHYDAIISDYHMPAMDGIEFLKAVRASGNPVPFIIFTGRGREEVVIQAINEGADFYLQKGGEPGPQFTELAHKIRIAIGKREAEEILKKSEEEHRAILRTAMDGFLKVDSRGRILEVNDAYCRMIGYRSEELTGMHVLDLEAVESSVEYMEHQRQMVRKGEDRFTSHHRRKDGTVFPVDVSIQFQPVDGGRFIVFVHDISGRPPDTDKALPSPGGPVQLTDHMDCTAPGGIPGVGICPESVAGIPRGLRDGDGADQWFEHIFRNNPAIMALSLLPERTYADVNTAFIASLGYSRDEVIGRTPAELGIFPDMGQLKGIMEEIRQHGHISNIEIAVRCKGGLILEGVYSGEIISSQGKDYLLSVLIDITERKELEHELLVHERELIRYSGELADDIAERARIETALRQSEEKFRQIFDSANDAIHLNEITEEGLPAKFFDVNAVACRMLQYSKEELLSMSPLEISTEYHSYPVGEIM